MIVAWKAICNDQRAARVKSRSLITLLLVLSISLLHSFLYAQEADADSLPAVRFLKADVELAEPGTYFNVLEVNNRFSKPLTGLVRLDCPDTWRIIGPPADTLTIEPGGSRLIPVRISIPGSTLGGVSYVIGAELFGEDLYDYANSYISIERKSRWELRLNTTQVYLSDFKPLGEIFVSIENRGNSNELVKLSFDMGGLLRFKDEIEADSFLYVDVPAYKDTSLRLLIQQRNDLSYAESQSLKLSWKARSLNIQASTSDRSASGSVRATTLGSSTVNRVPILNSPLNAEITIYNLLARLRKKVSTRVFGKVFFPDNQQLTYSIGYYNLYFDSDMNRDIDLYQQIRYMVRYTDPRSSVWLGDRIGVGTLHTLTGRGIRASYRLNDRDQVMLNVVQNPYAKNIGGFAGYMGRIGDVAWNTGITVEAATNQRYNHYSFHLGGSYQLKRKHSFELQTATSLSKFVDSRYLASDTTVAGLAYQFLYRYHGNQLRISLENTNTLFTYLRNSDINRINFSGMYKFEGNLQLKARYHRSDYSSTRYPYNFFNPPNTNVNDHARLLLSYQHGGIVYQGGPQYSGTVRNSYVPVGDYRTRYANYQPGIMGSVTFRLGNRRSISPNGSFNTMLYSYYRIDPGEELPGLENRWTYSLGINYYDQAFKLNTYYTSGEATDIYRTAVINDDRAINQAFHIRPYYERFFFNENLRLSTYFNYSYFTPSLRTILLFNLTGNVNMNHSWNFFSNFNVYQVSRNDVQAGRITNRSVNLILGIRKAFDIQQPRLAYYDLTIMGFNDLDGDGVKSGEEKPISNVLVNISRDPNKNVENKSGFAEIGMITDPQGEIYYENIPMGVYDLSIIPLTNLENLYFLHGEHQTIEINDDMVYFLPLVESYKIKGKIIIDRDPNSNEAEVSPEGIRITAVSTTGETYTALSSSFGTYVLDLPKANSYEVSIYNVFGENFRMERGSYKVQFAENRIINLDFKFTERRRGIQFNGSEEYYQFKLENDK